MEQERELKESWWIITFLADEGDLSNDNFAQSLDEHARAWSHNNDIEEQWWATETFEVLDKQSFEENLKRYIRNPLMSVNNQSPLISGDNTTLHIALVGDARVERTCEFLHCLASLLRRQGDRLFPKTTLNIITLLYLPPAIPQELKEPVYRFYTQLHTMMSDEFVGRQPFDAVLIVQERNQSAENRNGYTWLSEEQANHSLVQSMFHLMVGDGRVLRELQQSYRSTIFSMGSVAVYYDWKVHQRRLASVMGGDLIKQFAESESQPFVNNDQVRSVVGEVGTHIEARKLFQRLIVGNNRPSFDFPFRLWKEARNRQGKRVSPWAIFRKDLHDVYFQNYLRNLPFRLSEYSRIFLRKSLDEFSKFLKAQGEIIWKGSDEPPERGIQEVIRSTFVGILGGKHGRARSLRQVARASDEIKKACAPDIILSKIADLDDFSRLEVFHIPDFLRSYYDKAPDSLSAEAEAELYDKVVESVRTFLMPTALFLRAVLISLLMALLTYTALDLISPETINLEWLLKYEWVVRIVSGALPILIAGYHYYFRTLKLLDKRIHTYVAAVLKHAQTQAREMVRQQIIMLLGQARGYCDEIRKWTGDFGASLAYPEPDLKSYSSTTFQREVFEEFSVPGQSRSTGNLNLEPPPFRLEVASRRLIFEEFSNVEKNEFLHQVLDDERNGESLWQLISSGIPPEANSALTTQVGERCREFAETVYRGMSERQLHRLLESAIVSRMHTVSFPPVVLASGNMPIEVHFEWKHPNPDDFQVSDHSYTAVKIVGTSFASLAGFRPLSHFTDIALLRAFAQAVDPSTIKWDDPASLFAAASTQLSRQSQPGLKSLSDEFISLEQHQHLIEKLRLQLGPQFHWPSGQRAVVGSNSIKIDSDSPELEV